MALLHPNHLNSLILLKTLLAITAQNYPTIPKKCNTSIALKTFPGFGWDALQAQPRDFIFKITYAKCATTYSKFGGFEHKSRLTPDQLLLNSVRTKWRNYDHDVLSTEELTKTPSLVRFVNESESAIKGIKSDSFAEWKDAFHKHPGVVHRRQLIVERFEGILKTKAKLSENFVQTMNAVLDQQKRENENLVQKRVEELVEKFGTHYTTSAVYGANAYIDSYETKTKVAIKVEFVGGNRNVSPATKKWMDSTAEEVEIVSLAGDFIYSLLKTREEFTKYNVDIREKVHSKLFYYISNYYTEAVRSGCTWFGASNFNGKANKDDGSCSSEDKPIRNMALRLKPHLIFIDSLIIVIITVYY